MTITIYLSLGIMALIIHVSLCIHSELKWSLFWLNLFNQICSISISHFTQGEAQKSFIGCINIVCINYFFDYLMTKNHGFFVDYESEYCSESHFIKIKWEFYFFWEIWSRLIIKTL